jgi:glutamate synthase (ferredoxin)
MAQLGFRTINEMVGRVDILDSRKAVAHWKAQGLDFSNILFKPKVPEHFGTYCSQPQDHGIDQSLDVTTLLDLCRPALDHQTPVSIDLPIRNINRTVGTILSSEVTRRFGGHAFEHEDTIQLNFKGSAGQSLLAFGVHGVTVRVEGDVNDYCGKGLSGGKIIVYPPREATFTPEKNIIAGNVVLYGATSGELYLRGVAGERFCVRNSGAHAIVEGVGDHGCEYMTGGRAIILGETGRNFAAGMSGGTAYVLDEAGEFPTRCNKQMVDLEKLEDEAEIEEVRQMIKRHADYTKSQRAFKILALWEQYVPKFVKVMPRDYQRMLQEIKRAMDAGLNGEEAIMAAFEENAKDVSRVGGG